MTTKDTGNEDIFIKAERSGCGLSPRAIYNEVSKKVIGQEEAKRMIATTVFLHFTRYVQGLEQERNDIRKSNALLLGPTGCGKTFLIREAAKAVKKITGYDICPVLEVDCTELSSRGWEGDDLSKLICNHYEEHKDNEATANTTIVFLDEFDKICKPAISKGGSDHNKNTQYNLLKMIEGTKIPYKGREIDTSKMLFILAGNFSEVRHARKVNGKEKLMGFKEIEQNPKDIDMHTELENAGMVTQMVGRVPHLAELFELKPEELAIILEDHLLPDYKDTWEFLGKKLILSKKKRDIIVEDCYKRKTGARGLQADLAKIVEDKLFDTELKI
jgi:ATP-dependent Clp protease ATP-binding subunit ClpX